MEGKIAQPQIAKLLDRFPNLLDEQEKALPEDQRTLVIRHKINAILAKSQNLQNGETKPNGGGGMNNVPPQQGGRAQGGSSMQARPPPPNMNNNIPMGSVGMVQQGSQGQMMGGMNGQVGQSPQMVMQNLQQQQQPQMGMPQGGPPPQMGGGQQQAYQEQMRMQQHQQQQHHITQRMQAQHNQQAQIQQVQAQAQALASQVQNSGVMQQQQQQQQQAPQSQPPNPTMPSPQQPQGAMGSPMTNNQNLGRSPSTGRSSSISAGSLPGVKVLVDSFPKLLELKRQGRLTAEQDKLFDSVMSSEAGRTQLAQFHAQQANALIQSNLSNQLGHPTPLPQHQMPPQMTPQQQMAQLHPQQSHPQQQQHQQQQQQHQQQQHPQHQQQQMQQQMQQPQMGMQYPQGMMPSQQQLAQQQMQQQLHMRQQMAQQGMRPPNSNQAQLLARAQLQAQNQLAQQANQQMPPPNMQQGQQHQIEPQAGTPNYSSPRPPQAAQRAPISAEKMAQVKASLAKMSQLDDQGREQWFQQRPNDRHIWNSTMGNRQNQAAIMAQSQSGAPMGRPPPNNASYPAGNAGNMPNLHIPSSKQRNLSQGNIGSPAAAGTPPMRPLPNNPTPQQRAAIQQMLAAGIPVAGGVRPPMSMPQGPQGTGGLAPDIKPQQLLNQLKPQPADAGQAHPGAIRQLSEHNVAQLDRSGSLYTKTTWVPTSEYDAALREKLSSAQRPLRATGRSTLGQGLGVTRILSDVVLERLPEGLSAITDDTEGELVGDKKKVEEGSGMPGQKKRKVAELAETVDKGLEIDPHVESVILALADEHAELMDNLSSLLARHRKSSTIDRKDVQLAYELTESRSIPGFSSDSIRMDQAKSTKRAGAPLPAGRLAKLKLVSEAKSGWRKQQVIEREAKRARLDEEEGTGDGDEAMDGVEEIHGSGSDGESTTAIDGPLTSALPPQVPLTITA